MVGLITFIIIFISHLSLKGYITRINWDKLLDYQTGRKILSYEIINKVVVFLATTFIILGWPLAIFLKYSQIKKAKTFEIKRYYDKNNNIYKINKSDLIEELSITEIEVREFIFDPLNSVPAIPFGFLNNRWKDFISLLGNNDCIWSFRSELALQRGQRSIILGYVILNQDKLGRSFVTSITTQDK